MKTLLMTTLLFIGLSANAKTLTYQADFSASNVDPISLEICGYPEIFQMDAADPIGPTFIKQALFSPKVETQQIQATDGSLSGAQDSAYEGAYRTKVYIVKQPSLGAYPAGIYYRTEVTTYGSSDAPSGFMASTELLNYRESAELAEGAYCGQIYYKLK